MPRLALLVRCALASKCVEHPCQQCGTLVEDGRPFCPQCRAPQIHVQVASPDAEVVANTKSGQEGFTPEVAPAGRSDRLMPSGNTMDSGIAARAALKAGALGLFISAIPFIGILLTGALAVLFYRRKTGVILPASVGARLGGAAGVVVFAVSAVVVLAVIVLHAQQQCIEMTMTLLQRLGANTADARVQADIRNVFTPSGQALSFFVTVAFASAGGALASMFLRPRNPRM